MRQRYKTCFEDGEADALEYASCIIDFVSESYTSDITVTYTETATIGRSLVLSMVSDVLRDVAGRIVSSPCSQPDGMANE